MLESVVQWLTSNPWSLIALVIVSILSENRLKVVDRVHSWIDMFRKAKTDGISKEELEKLLDELLKKREAKN